MDTIKQLSYFFNLSPKRQGAPEKHADRLPGSKTNQIDRRL